jgi:alpha-glucosidase
LPFGNFTVTNLAEQRHDPDSTLSLTRDLISLRDATPELRTGAYATVDAPAGVWAWRRGDTVLVAVHLAGGDATLPEVAGTVRVGTDRRREGARVDGSLMLGPWEAVVIERG